MMNTISKSENSSTKKTIHLLIKKIVKLFLLINYFFAVINLKLILDSYNGTMYHFIWLILKLIKLLKILLRFKFNLLIVFFLLFFILVSFNVFLIQKKLCDLFKIQISQGIEARDWNFWQKNTVHLFQHTKKYEIKIVLKNT